MQLQRSSETHQRLIRDSSETHQGCNHEIRWIECRQCSSVAIRCTQMQSDAIRCDRVSSTFVSGNHLHAMLCRLERNLPKRRCSVRLPLCSLPIPQLASELWDGAPLCERPPVLRIERE